MNTGAGLAVDFIDVIRSLSEADIRFVLWNGLSVEPRSGADSRCTILLTEPDSALRLLAARTTRDLAEAYLDGLIDVQGSIEDAVTAVDSLREQLDRWRMHLRDPSPLIPSRPRLVGEVAGLAGFVPSEVGDSSREQIAFHYDKPAAYWKLLLDPHLQYTCGYYSAADETLAVAQESKLRLIGRKLSLSSTDKLLDLGCGWGGWLGFAMRQ